MRGRASGCSARLTGPEMFPPVFQTVRHTITWEGRRLCIVRKMAGESGVCVALPRLPRVWAAYFVQAPLFCLRARDVTQCAACSMQHSFSLYIARRNLAVESQNDIMIPGRSISADQKT
jgi:hypothetical protein